MVVQAGLLEGVQSRLIISQATAIHWSRGTRYISLILILHWYVALSRAMWILTIKWGQYGGKLGPHTMDLKLYVPANVGSLVPLEMRN